VEELFKYWTLRLSLATEAIAALVIGYAVVEAVIRTLRLFARIRDAATRTEGVRLRLGRWLALALEIELAADILRTAVAPTWNDIGRVAAIIVLRTVLNYFLQREIERGAADSASLRETGAAEARGRPGDDPVRAA
jgi:uncharacterized membrane protein